MKKTSKKARSPTSAPKRRVAIKDLKAKAAGSVKGGVLTNRGVFLKIDDVK